MTNVHRFLPSSSTGARLRCWLGPAKFEHRDGADPSGLALVLGETRVAPGLLSVDAVAFSAGQLADGDFVRLGSTFDDTVTCGCQVVVPVRTDGAPPLVAKMKIVSGSESCGRYLTGVTYSRP